MSQKENLITMAACTSRYCTEEPHERLYFASGADFFFFVRHLLRAPTELAAFNLEKNCAMILGHPSFLSDDPVQHGTRANQR